MITWLRKRKLENLLEELAIYNDKGIAWRGHDEMQTETERTRIINLIRHQIHLIGEEKISPILLEALKNGYLKTDLTGMYIEYVNASK